MKNSNNSRGFTLIEIIVVLIIVGILAAIALPNFFANINKGRSQVAFAAFETYKLDLEACLDNHIGNESVCAVGGALAVALPSNDTNFTYSQSPPVNTTSTGTGISAWSGQPISATLVNGFPVDSITLWRNPDGTYHIICLGAFNSLC